MVALHRPAVAARLFAAPLVALAALLALTGCSGGGQSALPNAADLLNRSAAAMASVRSADVDVQVDPSLSTVPIRSATGTLTAAGQATGKATVAEAGSTAEFNFVITGDSLYLKGPTGPYRQLPLALAASVYDPTALFDPQRGLPALLRSAAASSPSTEATEEVNGGPTYRVKANLDPRLVASVVPGLLDTQNPLPATLWLDRETSRLVKAQIQMPGEQGAPPAPVTVALSHFDQPVSINPPA
jgi:lipoprotein LprG